MGMFLLSVNCNYPAFRSLKALVSGHKCCVMMCAISRCLLFCHLPHIQIDPLIAHPSPPLLKLSAFLRSGHIS